MRSWKVWLALRFAFSRCLWSWWRRPWHLSTALIPRIWIEPALPARTSTNSPMAAGWRRIQFLPPTRVGEWITRSTERNRDILHQILEDAAKNTAAPHGSSEQKIGDYYGSCMDTAKIDSEGLKPLQPEFDRIQQLADVAGLEAEIAHLQSIGVEAFFDVDSTQDFKDSTQVTGGSGPGRTGSARPRLLHAR